jgi:hypothetical protein
MGIDVARHGSAQSVLIKRQGQKVWPPFRYRIPDLMLLGDKMWEEIIAWQPDAVFIDVTGMGWGLYDYLQRKAAGSAIKLYPIQVGEKAIDDKLHYNRRAEVWWRGKDWLVAGGCLPDDRELETDLTGPEYGYDARERVQLERKEDMEERGLASPDSGDAWALTFSTHVEGRKRKRESWRDRLKAHEVKGNYSPQAA